MTRAADWLAETWPVESTAQVAGAVLKRKSVCTHRSIYECDAYLITIIVNILVRF